MTKIKRHAASEAVIRLCEIAERASQRRYYAKADTESDSPDEDENDDEDNERLEEELAKLRAVVRDLKKAFSAKAKRERVAARKPSAAEIEASWGVAIAKVSDGKAIGEKPAPKDDPDGWGAAIARVYRGPNVPLRFRNA